MVKHLRIFGHTVKWFVLLSILSLMLLMGWLHKERSLQFAKPWIVSAVNDPAAPYSIAIGEVRLNWSDLASLGKMRITNVEVATRDGAVFAQFPEIYATIDPFGFLPSRRLLQRVMLRAPHMFMTRNAEGMVELGIENSPSRMPLAELTDFLKANDGEESKVERTLPTLPFREFIIDDANFTFSDAVSGTTITSNPFEFNLRRRHGTYDASLIMPFLVDKKKVMLTARLQPLSQTREHVLAMRLDQFPSKLACMFGTCAEGIAADGFVNGSIAIGVADKDLAIHAFHAQLSTAKALLTLPKQFAEPLKLGTSSLTLEGDWSKNEVALTDLQLQLEDTHIAAKGEARKDTKGWYVKGEGETTTPLDITKVYKYWPLIMAPDSRAWITAKLKSGYAKKGTLKLDLTPEDFAAPEFSEKSILATADAHEITFEYLPGFPMVEKMNGVATFTATTVKVEGGGGTLLTGTKVNRAVLWCPQLNDPKNPMETSVEITAPAADAVTFLALKHFPFDDKFGLDAKTITGTADAAMKLKFNAFSENPSSDPNELHLEAVDYDITATLNNIAQDKVYGGYNARSVNGTLKANNNGLKFDGAVQVGDAGTNNVKLSQDSGKPLVVAVTGQASTKEKTPTNRNDFNLVYASNTKDAPSIKLRGKTLDASVSYGGAEGGGILANFPALKLDMDLGQLILTPTAPFTNVVGTLNCTAQRCESANFTARAGKGDLTASIARPNGVRQLSVKGSDAGAILKAADISDRMTRGKLDITGTYDDSTPQPKLNGRLLITNFTLQNSQILGRILSIGSLTGLSNALTGSGISFDKLAANFTSHKGLITVDKGVANGTAIGITVGGTVDTNSSKFGLKGVVAPAYALNSFIGRIPLIGALAGGEEGLIAFNYWVNGTFKEPDVGVNPLSGLTPGFLRGIFGVFDADEAPADSQKPKDSRPIGSQGTSHVRQR